MTGCRSLVGCGVAGTRNGAAGLGLARDFSSYDMQFTNAHVGTTEDRQPKPHSPTHRPIAILCACTLSTVLPPAFAASASPPPPPPPSHAIVSSSVGPEYYVCILSFVDKTQLEPGCSVLLHYKVRGASARAGNGMDWSVRGGIEAMCVCCGVA